MKVLHIVPAAFDYFNDIRDAVFQLTEAMSRSGVIVEIFTLQYGSTSRRAKKEIRTAASGAAFQGHVGLEGIISSLDEFDVVHLHCPFLGAAGRLLDWKRRHPDKPLMITYHRDVKIVDLFSLFILLYNNYYLPKLFAEAEVISCFSADNFYKSSGRRWLKNKSKLVSLQELDEKLAKTEDVHLTEGGNKLQLLTAEDLSLACLRVYKNLLN